MAGASAVRSRATSDPAVRRTDVDGVPTFYAPLPGPLRAALIFRVGQADETMATRGITHLIEHLALTESERSPHDYNGATGRTLTNFVVAAEPAEVVEHLRAVCEALTDLPAHRLDHERRVLEAESAKRSRLTLPLWRWGAQGFGLIAYDEVGLTRLDMAEIQAWSTSHFTRGNAVLWLSGRPPKGMTLPLPEGPLLPVTVDPHDSVVPLPGWAPANSGTTALSYLTSRTSAGLAVGAVLSERLTRTLRHEQGLVYGVEAGLDRMTADVAEHIFVASGSQGSEVRVAEQVCEILVDLRDNGVKAEELAKLLDGSRPEIDEPPVVMMRLESHAHSLLLGRESPKGPAHYEAELKALRPEEVDAEVATSFGTLLLEVPSGATVPPALAAMVPQWSSTVLTGKRILPTRRHPSAKGVVLVLAPTGVSLRTGHGTVTIRYDDVVAMTPFTDGSRSLLARDGFTLSLLAEQWWSPKRITEAVDVGVARALWLAPVERTMPLSGGSAWRHVLRGTPPVRIGSGSQWLRGAAIAGGIALAGALSQNGSDSPPPAPDFSTTIAGFGASYVAALVPGQCLFSTPEDSTYSIVVPCGEPHSREVFATMTVPGETAAARAGALTSCNERLGSYTKHKRNELLVTLELATLDAGQSAAACEISVKGEELRYSSLESH